MLVTDTTNVGGLSCHIAPLSPTVAADAPVNTLAVPGAVHVVANQSGTVAAAYAVWTNTSTAVAAIPVATATSKWNAGNPETSVLTNLIETDPADVVVPPHVTVCACPAAAVYVLPSQFMMSLP